MGAIVLVALGLGVSATETNGSTGYSIPIRSCIEGDKYPVYSLCRDVVGNHTIAAQTNLTLLEDFVGKTFRSLIYVQSQGGSPPASLRHDTCLCVTVRQRRSRNLHGMLVPGSVKPRVELC